MPTPYHACYFSHELTRQHPNEGVDRLSTALFDACVDLNPHQIEAALFALRSPLLKGVILADEVGLGKTIEAGLVLCQYWAERKRRLMVVCPASLRKQWSLELQEKFNLPNVVLDASTYRRLQLQGNPNPFQSDRVVITSMNFASSKKEDIRAVGWDLTVIDEAHKLRNAYRQSNKTGQNIKWALADKKKLLLTATPLQNSLLELFGMSSVIDENLFGDQSSFRWQYMNANANLDDLRDRLKYFCKRTLRRDVLEYIRYTARKLLTHKFNPTDDEHQLYLTVSNYLMQEESIALPKKQRHLTAMILRKLLASSSHAVANTLLKMRQRLENLRTNQPTSDDGFVENLIEDEEMEEDLLDEILSEDEEEPAAETPAAPYTPEQLEQEIKDLSRYEQWARSIGIDTKSRSLLKALVVGFDNMASMNAQQKALIFTESRRTQEYLKNFLEANGYAGKVVLFNGTNADPESRLIIDQWIKDNANTGRLTGSRSVDSRTALIEHFRDKATIMIATEAAAEGVNLQFCSLVINYDLPWNPQRIEQRIGRCHRYGQKHDVVVINFLNERNEADRRVHQLLDEKFNLFNGVFGASDDVLGSIESGVDFERRIFNIYQQCRTPQAIDAAFSSLQQVQEAFKHYKSADKSGLQSDLDKAIEQARGLGVDPETTNRVKDLRQKMADSSVDVTALENEVFSHLFNFFRRYYSEGDFISQRRYKEGVYAIPYEGEEVKLYWANADQYYIKSSETFRDYTFKIAGGKRVRVHLVAASTEQDNNKAAPGKERRFVLAEKPLAEENGELFIKFEYRPIEGKEKQEDLNKQAIEAVLKTPGFEHWALELGKLAPTEKKEDRTVLEKHLTNYTARNTFDYFIHKDLGGFLRRELDFYIKNEVMHLDDIEHESAPKVEQYLSQIKVIRSIAHKIILFLEQLENFQKKLWLKKKFVIETNYCITLDRVPEELYPEIAANDAQREEWVRLFAIDEIKKDLNRPGYSKPLKVEFLKAHPFLVVDTGLFDPSFTTCLLAQLDELESILDGIAIHSDNFQALSLSTGRFRGTVRTTYIDPPYNTGNDGFPYKDSYQHSSWLAMLFDRLALGRSLDSPDAAVTISIDDEELDRLCNLLRLVYGENELAKLVWDRNRKNDAKYFSVGHEYMVVIARNLQHLKEAGVSFREPKDGIAEAKEVYDRLLQKHDEDWTTIRDEWLKWFDDFPVSDSRRRLMRYNKVGKRGPYRDDGNINWPGGGGPRYEVIHPVTKKPCKKPVSGWRYPTPDRFWEEYEAGTIAFGEDENKVPSTISYLFDGEGQVMPSVFYSYAQTASQEFDAIFGRRAFDNPKNWRDLHRVFRYLSAANSWIVDYFAGSGTTAHAVINLNRDDKSRRKYILVEMGAYFDTVLKPRIAKIIYSREWKDGKPVNRLGSSHAFKYLRLESYEDALNNLELKRTEEQSVILDADPDAREQYILSYMLDVESRGSQSLLNIEAFRNPDEYKLRVERNGEPQLVNVDLVETFNWLLGLTVKHIDVIPFKKGGTNVRVVQGTNPTGERVLVLWRNIDELDNDKLDEWFNKQGYNTRDLEYDLVYVNGDNNLENLRRADQTWKVRLIEEDFQRLMFDVQDV